MINPEPKKIMPWNPPSFDVWKEHEEKQLLENMLPKRGGILKQIEEGERVD